MAARRWGRKGGIDMALGGNVDLGGIFDERSGML